MKATLYVEYGQNQREDKALVSRAKEIWVNAGNKIKDIDTLNLYVKPEEAVGLERKELFELHYLLSVSVFLFWCKNIVFLSIMLHARCIFCLCLSPMPC